MKVPDQGGFTCQWSSCLRKAQYPSGGNQRAETLIRVTDNEKPDTAKHRWLAVIGFLAALGLYGTCRRHSCREIATLLSWWC